MTRARDVATQGGLTLILNQAFTTISELSIDNIFTSTYRDYRIIINTDSSSVLNADLLLRLRRNGADDTTNNHNQASWFVTDTAGSGSWESSGGRNFITLFKMDNPLNAYGSIVMDILNPQVQKFTMVSGLSNFGQSGANNLRFAMNSAKFVGTTQFDGFKISTTSGTATGNIRIYGYRN